LAGVAIGCELTTGSRTIPPAADSANGADVCRSVSPAKAGAMCDVCDVDDFTVWPRPDILIRSTIAHYFVSICPRPSLLRSTRGDREKEPLSCR
jgi:hypothetical protein